MSSDYSPAEIAAMSTRQVTELYSKLDQFLFDSAEKPVEEPVKRAHKGFSKPSMAKARLVKGGSK